MNVYLDASVILRVLLDEPEPLKGWANWQVIVSSEISKIEIWRTLYRLKIERKLTETEFKHLSSAGAWLLAQIDFLRLDSRVLRKAAGPYSTIVAALDSIHLSTALLWRETNGDTLTFLTHDRQLERAAVANGLATTFSSQP